MMPINVRPFVSAITHIEGCNKLHCGPACARVTDGWEYDIRVVLPNGEPFVERRKSPLGGKEATRRYAQERLNHVIQESVSPPAPAPKKEVPTFDAFTPTFVNYSTSNNRPSTVYAKHGMLGLHLSPFFGSMRLDEIGPKQIEAYKAQKLEEELSKKTINNHLTSLRKLVNLAVEYGDLDRAPKIRGFNIKPRYITEDEFLRFDEAERFLRAAAPEWKAFLTTGIKTGLRVGELLALKWQDVDLVAGQLVVRRTLWRKQEGPPKGGLNRTVPLSDVALATLKAHRHLRGPYIFCDEAGGRLSHSKVKNVVPATCRAAGLAKRITTHGLRHSFASHLVMLGVPLKAVQELLGHESIEMTLRYSHLTPDVKRDAVCRLDGPAAGDIQETGVR
jgi:integrase